MDLGLRCEGGIPINQRRYEAVIGLEVHCQLSLQSKLFSSIPAPSRSARGHCASDISSPNSLIDEVTLALPGSLPVVNEGAIDRAVLLGLALGCSIESHSVFARKHYFYPDLPKGYQITQYDRPICKGGCISLNTGKIVRIERIQIEEDAGKTMHEEAESLVDFNRAGVGLVEIVSEPDMRSASEAAEYLRKVHRIAVFYGVTDGDLERGNFRADANVSIRLVGETAFGTRTEIKNLNSFRFLERAIDLEIRRQIQTIESGLSVEMETRGYDAGRDVTFRMRKKEAAHDYRYFPDPDLPPINVDEFRIAQIREKISISPFDFKADLETKVGLSGDDAETISRTLISSLFYQAVCRQVQKAPPKFVGSFLAATLLSEDFEEQHILESDLFSAWIACALDVVFEGRVSQKVLREHLDHFVEIHLLRNGCPSFESWAEGKGLISISDVASLTSLAKALIAEFPDQASELSLGKVKVASYFVGQAMKRNNGALDAAHFRLILFQLLGLKSDLR